jgi:hypothetical protein
MIKALKKLGLGGTYLNIIKGIYDKPITNIIPNREKLKSLPVKGIHFPHSYSIEYWNS